MHTNHRAHPLVLHAKDFAEKAHAGQHRKGTAAAYIIHPAGVVEVLATVPHTPEMLAAAWLHDVVEDTPIVITQIQTLFGDEVARLVWSVTNQSTKADGSRKIRKAIDRFHLSLGKPDAKTLKLADICNNSEDVTTLKPSFAAIWLDEAWQTVSTALTEGDATLHSLARAQIKSAQETLKVQVADHVV